MRDNFFHDVPTQYSAIAHDSEAIHFKMASDLQTGCILKTLAASKPSGRFLELGTGSGLATSWIAAGMDAGSTLTTVENNELLYNIAKKHLPDRRIEFVLADGYKWLTRSSSQMFDLIFADAIPGKYDLFEETIKLLKNGGLYVVDDMLPQSNWPNGHDQRVADFISMLECRSDLAFTKMNWSTGIIIATKLK